MNPVWYPVLGTLLLQVIGFAVAWGALGQKIKDQSALLQQHDTTLDNHGERLVVIETKVGVRGRTNGAANGVL